MAGPGRRGPAPKPNEAKRRAGNPGHRPLPEPTTEIVAPDRIPPAPPVLAETGRAAWQQIWEAARPWLAASDVQVVTLICRALDEREKLRATVELEGMTFTTEKGYVGVHPALSELRKLDQQLTTWLGLVGLTPADRSRLGFAEIKRVSKLAEFTARHRHGRDPVDVVDAGGPEAGD